MDFYYISTYKKYEYKNFKETYVFLHNNTLSLL